MYTIGREYLRADVEYMIPDPIWKARDFMTFDPVDTVYHPPGTQGSYISRMPNIEGYGRYYNDLRTKYKSMPPSFYSYYILALIFDFMAFTAQTFRALLGTRVGTESNLSSMRELMNQSLDAMLEHQLYDDHLHETLYNVFRGIITEIGPIPVPTTGTTTPPHDSDTRPQKYITPRAHHRHYGTPHYSPEIPIDDITSEVFQRFEGPHQYSPPPGYYFSAGEHVPYPVYDRPLQLAPDTSSSSVPDTVTYPSHSSSATASASSTSASASSSSTAPAPHDSDIGSSIACTPDDAADYSLFRSPNIPFRPPTPPNKRKHDDMDKDHSAKLVIETHHMYKISKTSQIIFDSGCSITGTSNADNLHDVTDCGALSVQGAFGPSIQPSKRGKLGPLGLDAIVIDGMDHQVLVSLSQYCQGGTSGKQHAGLFTGTDFRMFELSSILPALKLLSEIGIETTRGTVQGGIYIEDN
jgi:hypothetical protein